MSGIELRQIGNASFFKIGLVTGACFWGLVGTIFGLAALAGANVVFRNGVPVHGVNGFATSMVLACVLTLIHSMAVAFGGAMARSFPATRLLFVGSKAEERLTEAETH